jgi:RNA polymerase sigma-70 factor (ECF subfamily)
MVNSRISTEHNRSIVEHAVAIEYIDGLYSYALVLSANHAEAEDLVQETHVRAMQAMGRLRADSSVKSWLFTILRNNWLNQLRRKRARPQMIELDVEKSIAVAALEASANPHSSGVPKLESEQMRKAIQGLAIEFREIILLREYEEFSYQEIAAVINCPIGTVVSRLGRARSKLRDLLSEAL